MNPNKKELKSTHCFDVLEAGSNFKVKVDSK